ncbi:MAG TPA: ribbon-helix-helix domain-containing protein [Candidatus Dormibacteraeota bacterium]|nr:ribbon-helix-helix domain-containing protein [Candidatus Dormibacteraeota bacterium]
MPKPNPLTQGLEQQSQAVKARTASKPDAIVRGGTPSRSGRVLVGGHFAPEVQTALKIIAAEERTTIQSLLAEAINTVFAKRGKPQIADIQAN